MEELPVIRIKMDGEPFEATPENTSLFLFLGDLALYNHIFLQTGDESGRYLFDAFSNKAFEKMSDYMSDQGYPMHVNLRDIAQCDLDAFENNLAAQLHDLEQGVPEQW